MVLREQGKESERLPFSPRVVLHVDLDAFFVQVERSLNPTLVGKPMAIQQHADIIAVSYEARKMGVTKHMPTRTIRQHHPSVKLVHVETIGIQNEKVSYRNYRKAARSIFALIKAFCPPEDVGKDACGGGGKFQKASIDEAYLEPTRRTLTAELHLVQKDKNPERPSTVASNTQGEERWTKRTRNGEDAHPFKRSGGNQCHPSCSGGQAKCLSGSESGASQSQGGGTGEEASAWDIASPSDEQPSSSGRRRDGLAVPRSKDDEQEENRLLQAGGLLGKRIQRTLREVLDYDCSVGVAGNKFLAKLVTSLAKPKGVRVLLRRDVASLLASTPATKIPGCGAGSTAAKHFLSWGAVSMLDLRSVEAAELRELLGEQLGEKVYNRCRGIDVDPIEPDPVPSRVSTQLSLVPLIKPASCLGLPGQELSPVFPWELERLRLFLATLVEDLVDRMKEEVAERNRRPTKLCIEYHIFQRGSRSQTFVLPAMSPRTRTRLLSDEADQTQQLRAAEVGIPALTGIVPATETLIELALTPFKAFRDSGVILGGSMGGGGGGGGVGGNTGNQMPPVVKLNIALLGFTHVGPAVPAAVPPGQRRLRDMIRRGNNGSSTPSSRERGDAGSPSEAKQTPTDKGPAQTAAASVAGSPTASIPESPTSSVARGGGTRLGIVQATEGCVLIRCPRCKACLPVGEAWDQHREKHLHSPYKEPEYRSSARQFQESSSALTRTPSRSSKGYSRPLSSPTIGHQRSITDTGDRTIHGNTGAHQSGQAIRGSPLKVATKATGQARENVQSRRARLSELFQLAVTPEQAADVLTKYGLMPRGGQTRFARAFPPAE